MKTLLSIILILCIAGCSQKPEGVEIFPGPIDDPVLIYHPESKGMLLLGGVLVLGVVPVVPDSVQSDVWKWNEQGWSKLEATGPGTRIFFKGDLNAKTGEVQLFGGSGFERNDSQKKDLWSFNGIKWSKIDNNDIDPHDHHKMVYADHLDAFVIYGGNTNHTSDTATWLMRDGKFWKLDIPGPGVKYQSGMVYDKHRKKVVLYGGGDKPDEHWEFDGEKWEKIITDVNPGIKLYHHMAYDENLKAVILHGGQLNHNSQDSVNLKTPATWLWDGKTWKKIAEEWIYSIAIGYHPVRKSVIAYGYSHINRSIPGNLQVWELKNYAWTKIADYGEWSLIQYLEKNLKQKPDDKFMLESYAHELKRLNRLPEAEGVFKKIVSLDATNENYLVGLIEVLYEQNRASEAEKYVSEVVISANKTRDFYANLGVSLLSVKKYQMSIQCLEKANEIQPKGTDYYNTACAYSLINNKDKAFESLDKAVENEFNSKRQYKSDADLGSLKSDDRWKVLLGKLK